MMYGSCGGVLWVLLWIFGMVFLMKCVCFIGFWFVVCDSFLI